MAFQRLWRGDCPPDGVIYAGGGSAKRLLARASGLLAHKNTILVMLVRIIMVLAQRETGFGDGWRRCRA